MAISKVADGQTASAAQYNAVVDAVQDTDIGHAHTGATNDGHVIDHTDLSNIGSNTHANIDTHIAANSAHGIHALAKVMGQVSTPTAFTFEAGAGVTGSTSNTHPEGWEGTVTTNLSSVAGAIAVPDATAAAYGYDWTYVTVNSPSAGQFKVKFEKDSAIGVPAMTLNFFWLAWGTKS